ncbi:MAG: hypothetical protein PW790_00930 [Parvibaculaceae bacterium]|nr:hypothetical protein [Parvibaculaceae bacterium]
MAAAHADTVQQQCADQWKTDKAAGKIPDGTNWAKFYSACAARLKMASTGSAASAASATSGTTGKPQTSGQQTPGQIAAHQRVKKCGAEWQEKKAANKLPAGAKWPQFWSECNTRLKAQGN